jgi:tryptophan synthase alpha chain
MSERIETCFSEARKARRRVLVGYLTAGDPDMKRSESIVREALDAGVDILELGVPFSDPTADGPVIQEASQRSLAAGARVSAILDMVRRLRRDRREPIVLFGYANPFYRYGYERLCRDAAAAGADGLLVVDLPFEESGELRPHADRSGLCLIPLVAPTTPPDRARRILVGSRGFVYYIMVRGVTGARASVAADVEPQVAALRRVTTLPVAAGFGVSTADQVRRLAPHADAIVIGSAMVRAASEGRVGPFVRSLQAALSCVGQP